MNDVQQIVLNWKGPLRFGATSEPPGLEAMPPAGPGVYVWAVEVKGDYLASYIGQTGNLRDRILEHSHGLLGGQYWIYDPEKLASGEGLECVYKADPITGNWSYVAEFERLGPIALANLLASPVFWAEVPREALIRKCVESGLIAAARGSADSRILQNLAVSVGEKGCPQIQIQSVFPEGAVIGSLDRELFYGGLP